MWICGRRFMSKNVQFDYFKVYRCFVRNGQLIEEPYNLNEVLEVLDELTIADTTRACMSEQARVQFLNFNRNTNYGLNNFNSYNEY